MRPEYACAAMKETLEREIKLAPEEGFVLPELGGRRMPTRVFISTYHDTADLRLARHGITFRHRVEDGAGPLAAEAAARCGPARARARRPARPPARRARSTCCPPTSAARSSCPSPGCAPAARWSCAQGAEIVDDSVAVLEGQRVSRRFREVEVELIDGDEQTLRPAREGAAQGRRARDRRAAAEALPGARPRTARPTTPKLTKDTPPGEALGIALEAEYRALLAHDPGTRRGDDPEEPASAPRRHPAAAGVPPRGAPARRSRVGRVAARGARLARRPSRAGARPRRDARPAARRGGGARRRRRGGGRACSQGSRPTARTPTGTSSRRCGATATSRCSTGSKPRPTPPLSGEEKTLAKIFHREAKRMRRDVRRARRRPRGRRPARVPDRRQARALRRGPRRPRARQARREVRRRREAAAGHPRRPPGRRRRPGANPASGPSRHRPRERVRRRPARAARARPDGGCPRRLARHRGSGSTTAAREAVS